MNTLEALSENYLAERIAKIMELSKSRNTALMSGERQESRSDIFFKTERQMMGIDCMICRNTGIIVYPVNGYLYSKECSCMDVYKNRLRIKKSGLERIFQSSTFDKYVATHEWQRTIKEKALRFLNEPGKWFYIGGAVGSGKSHICTAICTELIKQKPVYFMPWRDEIVRIKANATNDEEYQKIVHKLKTIGVLYIDDFFKGSISQADINTAFEILNYRYNNRLTTIISSEHDVDRIIDLDQAIGSRIYQMAKDYALGIPDDIGRNYRLC